MNLPDSLVKQFTEITNDEPKKEQDNECYGTVTSDGKVLLDGSSTPLSCKKIVTTNEGDRVLVKIKNHQATIIGNLTSPAADSETTNDRIDEAMTSANGKNKLFHQATAPLETAGLTPGDIWFDTANDCHIHTWTGTEWSAFELGEDAIADMSITNAKIHDLNADKMTAGTLDVGRIAAGSIKAEKLDVTDLFSKNITATGRFQIDNDVYQLILDDIHKYVELSCGGNSIYISKYTGVTITLDDEESTGANIYLDSAQIFGNLYVNGTIHGTPGYGIQLPNNTWNTVGDDVQIGDVNAAGKIGIRGLNGPTGIRFVPNVGNTNNVEQDLWSDGAGSMRVNGNFIITGGYYVNEKQYLTKDSVTIDVSCGANNTISGGQSVAKTGYTPIGVIGFNVGGSGSSYISLFRLYLNGSNLMYNFRNNHGSVFNGSIKANILYMAT